MFILKKNWLCEGSGIPKHRIDSEREMKAFFKENKGDNVVEELVEQHPILKQLHPQSVNTIRIFTLYHNGKAHALACALRVGTGDNCTDNLHNAGVACAVDPEDGIVISYAYDKNSRIYKKHPDSQIPFLGYAIPNWEIVKQTAIKAAEAIPSVHWIGWDMAVTETACVIIEGNTGQSEDLIQVGQDGLLPRIKQIQQG